jgi:histone H2B
MLSYDAPKPKPMPKSKKHRKSKGSERDYKRGLWKLNKQINRTHPHSVSGKAMTILNDFVIGNMTAICELAMELCKKNNKKTLSSREIQSAVRLYLPGYGKPNSLCDHAVAEGTKSVTRWYCSSR